VDFSSDTVTDFVTVRISWKHRSSFRPASRTSRLAAAPLQGDETFFALIMSAAHQRRAHDLGNSSSRTSLTLDGTLHAVMPERPKTAGAESGFPGTASGELSARTSRRNAGSDLGLREHELSSVEIVVCRCEFVA
jgi:hypothetical protein